MMPITIKPVRREHRAIPPRPVLELARYVVADAHKAYAKAGDLAAAIREAEESCAKRFDGYEILGNPTTDSAEALAK